MPLTEYEPGTTFPGVIGRMTDESSPAWPRPLRADAGSPNVLIVVLDDVGYGQLGCYGSPIATPNLDALAAGGLLYNSMHTSQWYPDLIYDNHPVEPPRTPEQGYHLTGDLADKAIEFIADAKQVAPHKPFYLQPTGKPDFAQGQGAPGLAQLYVDGQLIANTEFPVTTPIAFNPGGLTCGANPGSAIVGDYQAPFPFTGTLHTVTIDLSGELITDTESEIRMAMARQ